MVGMRSDEEILNAFEGLTTVPGSKVVRRDKRETPAVAKEEWDSKPLIKMIGGVPTEVYTISALATALGKSLVTIRQWEAKAYIPQSPYRLRNKTLKGQKTAGNRVYTRPLIVAAIEEFNKRGLLGKARVEWSQHRDLTLDLHSRWSRIVNN